MARAGPEITHGENVRSLDAVILGRIGYDLYSEEPHVPLPEVRRFSRYLGGSSANMAVGLSRLGASIGIVSCLGDDSLSRFLTNFLESEKVDTNHVKTAPGYLPSLAITEVSPPDRFPQVFYRRDPVDIMLDLAPDDLEYAASGRMFITNGTSLCASPSRESTYLALERAKEAGRRVVLDVDYRSMSWRKPEEAGLAVRLALPFVDVLIGNQPELKLVAGVDDLDQATEKLQCAGARVGIQTGRTRYACLDRWRIGLPAALPGERVHHDWRGRRLRFRIPLCHAAGPSDHGVSPLWQCRGRNRGQPSELFRSHAQAPGSGRDDAATKEDVECSPAKHICRMRCWRG
jgi:sugar/nucleoside kinase (ribokinase family)